MCIEIDRYNVFNYYTNYLTPKMLHMRKESNFFENIFLTISRIIVFSFSHRDIGGDMITMQEPHIKKKKLIKIII